MGILESAIALAKKHHSGQYRKYSQPGQPPEEFFVHPFQVYSRALKVPGVTEAVCAAAILHDVVEDTACTPETIAFHCGQDVTDLVLELTNRSAVDPETKKMRRADRKRIDRERIGGCSSWAKKLKMIDRTCNLMDMHGAPIPFKKLYLEESRLLLEVLRDADAILASEFEQAMRDLEESITEA